MIGNGASTRRHPVDHDVVGVAPELLTSAPLQYLHGYKHYLLDVLFDPSEGFALVQQSGIQVPVLLDSLAGQEAKGTNTIIECYKYDRVTRFLYDLGSVVVGIRVLCVAPTLYEEPNR